MKIIDLKGKRFGKLVVVEMLPERTNSGSVKWKCQCDCGNVVVVASSGLQKGTKSCGCFLKEWNCSTKRIYNYDRNNKRLYNIWRGIKARTNPKGENDNSKIYAKRGIKMCDEWHNNFMSFYNWAINNGYKSDLTIDRINVNGDYEPNNCRWSTHEEQANNRRTNIILEYKNETHTVAEWCKILDVPYYRIMNGLRNNKKVEDIFEKIIKEKKIAHNSEKDL